MGNEKSLQLFFLNFLAGFLVGVPVIKVIAYIVNKK